MEIQNETPNLIGYARVSTQGQSLDYQLKRLKAAGCQKIFHEKCSGKSRDGRVQLARLLRKVGTGDVLLATTTDRIARDPIDLLNILQIVKDKGAGMRLVDEPFIDTTSEMSDLIAFVVGWAARWQRKRILEDTAKGRAEAKARGVKFGRKPKLNAAQRQQVQRRRQQGELIADIAQSFGVSQSTISRVRVVKSVR